MKVDMGTYFKDSVLVFLVHYIELGIKIWEIRYVYCIILSTILLSS